MTPDTGGDETYWSLRLSSDVVPEGQGNGEKPEQSRQEVSPTHRSRGCCITRAVESRP